MDDTGKTVGKPGRSGSDTTTEKGAGEKLQPAVREGTGRSNGGAAVKKDRTGTKKRTSDTKVRGASKERAKPGAAEESGDDTEYAPSEQSESPGKGLGRDKSGR